MDSGGPLPGRVQCLKSGKCSCDCHFSGPNDICHHCLAVAIHLDCVAKVATKVEILPRFRQPPHQEMLVERPRPVSDVWMQVKL